uniref:Uncharacterized protein n=1 Tax=Aureoumbra lagunensis TaxID=44058 RepID=A0A7S3NHG4_9STRA|mmetsp:Transcript_6843/g.9577  ORF Transcript_6843/g.9577 Transcript_6843/m.9577 type:complete len:334 (-) Transcript_6843:2-1003(-)
MKCCRVLVFLVTTEALLIVRRIVTRRGYRLQAISSLDEETGIIKRLKRGESSRKPSVSVWYAPGAPMPGLEFAHGIAALTASTKLREEARVELIVCDEASACQSIVDEQKASENQNHCLVAFAGSVDTALESGASAVVCAPSQVQIAREAGLIPLCCASTVEEVKSAVDVNSPVVLLASNDEKITTPTSFEGVSLRILDAAAEKDTILQARDEEEIDGALLRHSSPDVLLAAVSTIRSTQSRTFSGFLSNSKSTNLVDDEEMQKAKNWASFVMTASDAGLIDEFDDGKDDEDVIIPDEPTPLVVVEEEKLPSSSTEKSEERTFDPDKGDWKGF